MARVYVRDSKGRFAEVPGARAMNRADDLHELAKQDEEVWIQHFETLGISRDEYHQINSDAIAYLQDVAANWDVEIAVSDKTLEGILKTGEYRNVHATGKTSAGGGMKGKAPGTGETRLERYMRARKKTEGILFDAQGPDGAPAYGFMSNGSRDVRDKTASYGSTVIKLKSDIKERVTMTHADSLDSPWVRPMNMDRVSGPLMASPMTVANKEYLPKEGRTPKDAAESLVYSASQVRAIHNVESKYGYIEAQIHGGVKVSDIDRVVFRGAPSAAIMKQLDKSGIQYEVQT